MKFATPLQFCMAIYYGWIGRDNKGDFYCVKFLPSKIALFWDGNAWQEISFDAVPKSTKPLESEEAFTLFKDNPPHDLLKQIDTRIRKDMDDALLHRYESGRRRVIGWAYSPEDQLKEGDCDEDCDAAVVADIMEHGYSMCSDHLSSSLLLPVFDNYEFATFSFRGFATLMAIAHGNHDPFGYVDYFFDEDDTFSPIILPKKGRYPCFKPGKKDIDVSEEDFDAFISMCKEREEAGLICSVPLPQDGSFYFLEDEVRLCASKSKRSLPCLVNFLRIGAKDEEEEEEFQWDEAVLLTRGLINDEKHLLIGLVPANQSAED